MNPNKPSRQRPTQRTLFENQIRWHQLPVSVRQDVVDGLTTLLLKTVYQISEETKNDESIIDRSTDVSGS
jgi:hypothetical protein